MAFEAIEPNGDLTIVCKETSFLVSSYILSLASPVFKAMLSGGFKEGLAIQNTRPGDTAEINLPEDNADAFRIFADLSHHRYDSIPDQPDLDTLEALAVVVDKYECIPLVKHQATAWLNHGLSNRSSEELWRLLDFAFALNSQECVTKIAHILVKERSDLIWRRGYAAEHLGMLPAQVIGW